MRAEDEFTALWADLLRATSAHSDAVKAAYDKLESEGRVSKVVVHRFLCKRRSCTLATVIKTNRLVIARTRDYKLVAGVNAKRSVSAARREKTIDGDRHWPGHTFDVSDLATSGPLVGIPMNCRHIQKVLLATDIMLVVDGVEPGRPSAPTLL
jgi:hypothetical protein